ncbi:MAG: hypothetical protein IT435_04760 [Phycisphaerales bacterium]|nr:hypothetical protein [Phycisphaerales bacterium]
MNKSIAVAVVSMLAGIASAGTYQVEINGTVEYNQIRGSAIDRAIITAGAPVTWSFLLDSGAYMNDPDGLPTRGYFIDKDSFTATFDTVSIGLQNPFPDGQIPMFVLRNNDPAVDGFFLSTGTAWDVPLPTTEAGFFGQLGCHFAVGYEGDLLSSLDIAGAVGTHAYDGLTSFYFSMDDGGMDPMWINFDSMSITAVPSAGTLALLAPLAMLRRRR